MGHRPGADGRRALTLRTSCSALRSWSRSSSMMPAAVRKGGAYSTSSQLLRALRRNDPPQSARRGLSPQPSTRRRAERRSALGRALVAPTRPPKSSRRDNVLAASATARQSRIANSRFQIPEPTLRTGPRTENLCAPRRNTEKNVSAFLCERCGLCGESPALLRL
jgi:hypothetical protein